jgi:hypothetical protein
MCWSDKNGGDEMAWKQISECLPAWLTAIEKGAGANAAPASACQGDTTLPVQEDDTDKERRIALANQAGMGSPSPAVRRSLFVVVEGGRPTGGGDSRAAYRAATREGSRVREFLKLVVG